MFTDSPLFSLVPRLGDEQPCKDRALRLDRRAGSELLDALGIAPGSAKEADIIRRLVMDLLEADYEFHGKSQREMLEDEARVQALIRGEPIDANLKTRRHVPRSISYSRNISRYTGMSRYYGKTYSYKSMLGAVQQLKNGGFIYEVLADQSPPVAGKIGHQSTITATGSLIEIAAENLFGVEPVPGELVRLKDADKRLVPYKATDFTRSLHTEMRAIGELLASVKIELPGSMHGHKIIIQWQVDGKNRTRQIPARTLLYRVFSRSDWQLGGRLYGPWWQNVPKTERAKLLIDGEPVSECDYSSIHPQIIFARQGEPFDFDRYNIEGFTREEIKLGVLIALNVESPGKAVYPLAAKLMTLAEDGFVLDEEDDDYDDDENQPLDPTAIKRARRIIKAIQKDAHPVLAEALFTGVGIELQAHDSRLIVDVLLAAQKKGIVCLPIHDSIVARKRDIGQVKELMKRHFHARFPNAKSPCKIKVSTDSLLHNDR